MSGVDGSIVVKNPAAQQDTIALVEGWNFISIMRQPANNTISSVLVDISPDIHIVWGFDNQTKQWFRYAPSGTANSLSTVDPGKGYWIHMSKANSLTFTGTDVSPTFTLYAGWNLAGYNGHENNEVSSGLQSLGNTWSIIWNWHNDVWTAKHTAIENLPVAALTSLNQRKAYWIRIKNGADSQTWVQPTP
jgi:hypothetical protein